MREILDADILFISLCPAGKNGLATLYKADGHAEFQGLTKALDDFDERGQLVACVWAPDKADSEGDFARVEAIEKMAHSFLRNAGKVDLLHDCKALGADAAFVAESFIIQKGDPRFDGMTDYDGEVVDVTGGWGVVMQINDPALRKAYRDGEWAGVSMYGPARVREAELDKAKVKALRNLITPQENDMKPEEIQAALTKGLADFAKSDEFKAAVKAAVAPPKAPEPDPKKTEPEAPKLPDGIDLDDPEALAKHAAELTAEARKAEVKWDDPKSVAEYAEYLKAQKADPKKSKKPKSSNVGDGDAEESEDEEAELIAKGRSFAAILNKRRGVA
jgi:hypothetical protein